MQHLIQVRVGLALLATVACVAQPAWSQSSDSRPSSEAQTEQQRQPTEPLSEVLEALSRKFDTEFVVHARVPDEIALGTLEVRSMTMDHLRLVLRANGLYLQAREDVHYVTPDAYVRTLSTRYLAPGETVSTSADEVVTTIIPVANGSAAAYVPMLRPVMRTSGHLAASKNANALIASDTYASIQRLRALVEELDKLAALRPQRDN